MKKFIFSSYKLVIFNSLIDCLQSWNLIDHHQVIGKFLNLISAIIYQQQSHKHFKFHYHIIFLTLIHVYNNDINDNLCL